MRIQTKDLIQHLKHGLEKCYFVFGEEALQKTESIDAIRAKAKQQGYTEREVFQLSTNFEWASLLSSVNTPSLFSEKRLIECYLDEGKIGKGLNDTLAKLSTLPISNSVLLLLSASKIDTKTQQSKGFLALEKKGITLCAKPHSTKEALLWIENRLSETGIQSTPEAREYLFERTEGNLLATSQVIEKLRLCADPQQPPTLSVQAVRAFVERDARFTIYDLVDAALSGLVGRTSRIFWSLKNQGVEPLLILWAITREMRTVLAIFREMQNNQLNSNSLSKQGVWKHRESLVKTFMHRSSIDKLQKILLQSKHIDDIIKGRAQGSAWNPLFSICLTLTGAYHG